MLKKSTKERKEKENVWLNTERILLLTPFGPRAILDLM